MRKNLLIVDDDIFFLEAICNETDFPSIGFSEVFKATSLVEARSILTSHPIAVLLCDIELPGENGLDLIEWIQTKNLPVVTLLLTCYSSFDYARRALRLSVSDYLLKPIRSEVLTERLSQVLDSIKESPEPTSALPESDLVYKIQEYIDANIHTELTREQLGKDFFMNADYIARLFRNRTGVSLNEYIKSKQIERAKQLLCDPKLPISTICSMVGYSYNTYFFNTFKNATGLSPAEYRKKHASNHELRS